MEKIAIGPGFEPGVVDLDFPPAKNLERLAAAKGVAVAELTACILDRPRHARLIAETRAAGAAIRLISDGDIAGVIHCAQPQETGIDIYMGVGGAPEGVLAAAALRCIGGQMQARMHPVSEDQRGAAAAAGLRDLSRKYSVEDMAAADVIFAATGVTGGSLLQEVKFAEDYIETHSLVMRGSTGTVRWLRARHTKSGKSPF
jgi:fructose-1,6-bisphosphatase II / sedoheptulose-1,7-bisphosphatase